MEELGRTIVDSIKLIDSKQKSISYEGLAIRAAELGDSWLALHSQVLADASTYKVLAEPYEDKDASLAKIEKAIAESFKSKGTKKSYSAVVVVESFRKSLLKNIDSNAALLLGEMLSELDHLSELTIAAKNIEDSLGQHRFSSIDGYDYIRRKQDEATKLYIQAINHKTVEPAKSVVFLYQGDLAVFESWLVSQSVMVNDTSYVVAALRWSLASAALNNLEGLPSEPKAAAREIRKALLWAVGPENSKSLSKYLLKF